MRLNNRKGERVITMDKKIKKATLRRKLPKMVVATLIVALALFNAGCSGVKSETTETQVNTEATAATENNSVAEKSSTTLNTVEVNSAGEAKNDYAELKAELDSAVIKYLDAFYEWNADSITSIELEEEVKSSVTEKCYRKYFRPVDTGTTAFLVVRGDVSTYRLDSLYYSDLDTDTPKVAALYMTKQESDGMSEPLYYEMFQAYTLVKSGGVWLIDSMRDGTMLERY